MPSRVKFDMLCKFDRSCILDTSINFDFLEFTMTANQRNRMWIEDHAWAIGLRKSGMAKYCFTVGEVKEALGFSKNTVKKYIAILIAEGIVREVVFSKSITIYKFSKHYIDIRGSQYEQPL